MTNDTIPTPDRSGSTGNQIQGSVDEVFNEARSIGGTASGFHLVNTVEGIAARNSRAFGGDIATALISAATRQMGQDYSDVKKDNGRLKELLEKMRDELETTRTKNAVLSERIRAEGKNKLLRNFGITVGTGLVGIGITLSRTQQDIYSIGAIVSGALLLLLSWFSGPKEESK